MTESERSGERLLQAARRVSAANQLTESERSGERLPLAARRVRAANQFAGYTGGLWEWIGYDGLEGQRPRLTHF